MTVLEKSISKILKEYHNFLNVTVTTLFVTQPWLHEAISMLQMCDKMHREIKQVRLWFKAKPIHFKFIPL